MKLLLKSSIIALPLLAAVSAKAEVTGAWTGSLDINGVSLPLVFDMATDGNAATMQSPLQSDEKFPVDIAWHGDTVTITQPMMGVRYTGVAQGDCIDGTFTQRGMSFSLTLTPGAFTMRRPQTPTFHPYLQQEVTFVNPVDSTELHGTLTLPYTYSKGYSRGIPAVVMVSGSGLQNRDEEIFGHRPFAVIAHNLAMSGIASLRYDDRGWGTPHPDPAATTATYSGDAEAAVAYLRSMSPTFRSVGVIGHSEGGSIAYRLGAKGVVDFIVPVGGPTLRGDSVLMMQNKAILGPVLSADSLDRRLASLRRSFDSIIANGREAEVDDAMLNPWIVYFITYDPAADVRSLACPVMAVAGELDTQVDAEANISNARRLAPDNCYNTYKIYRGLNHLMQHCRTGLPNEYPFIEETFAPEVMTDMAKWILALP